MRAGDFRQFAPRRALGRGHLEPCPSSRALDVLRTTPREERALMSETGPAEPYFPGPWSQPVGSTPATSCDVAFGGYPPPPGTVPVEYLSPTSGRVPPGYPPPAPRRPSGRLGAARLRRRSAQCRNGRLCGRLARTGNPVGLAARDHLRHRRARADPARRHRRPRPGRCRDRLRVLVADRSDRAGDPRWRLERVAVLSRRCGAERRRDERRAADAFDAGLSRAESGRDAVDRAGRSAEGSCRLPHAAGPGGGSCGTGGSARGVSRRLHGPDGRG